MKYINVEEEEVECRHLFTDNVIGAIIKQSMKRDFHCDDYLSKGCWKCIFKYLKEHPEYCAKIMLGELHFYTDDDWDYGDDGAAINTEYIYLVHNETEAPVEHFINQRVIL